MYHEVKSVNICERNAVLLGTYSVCVVHKGSCEFKLSVDILSHFSIIVNIKTRPPKRSGFEILSSADRGGLYNGLLHAQRDYGASAYELIEGVVRRQLYGAAHNVYDAKRGVGV